MKNQQDTNIISSIETISSDELLSTSGGNVFLLARLAMLRALEINLGSKPLVAHTLNEKETTIALREILEGKVAFKNADSQGSEIEKRVVIEDSDNQEDTENYEDAVSKIENIVDEVKN